MDTRGLEKLTDCAGRECASLRRLVVNVSQFGNYLRRVKGMLLRMRSPIGSTFVFAALLGSLLGCNDDNPTSLSGFGNVVVAPSPDSINAPWQLTGPDDYLTVGSGELSLSELAAGNYTVEWGEVTGWERPNPYIATKTLTAGATVTFSGFYVVDSGTVVIDPFPDFVNAPWTLTDLQGNSDSGSGDSTLIGLPVGDYTVTWGEVAGWIAPMNETKTLDEHTTVIFSGAYTESVGDFVLIPAGSYWMGAPGEAPGDEPGSQSDEFPRHHVTLSRSFLFQSTEVTNQQFILVAQWAVDNGYATVASGVLLDAIDGSTAELLDMNSSNSEVDFSDGVFSSLNPDHPMIIVTWFGAASYCDWLSLREGQPRAYDHITWQCNSNDPYAAQGYRLPTEAEWEFACRAGSTTAFSNGEITDTECNDPVLDQIGWYCGNAGDGRQSVGMKIPNAWGLYDMHGNVFEWCNDRYANAYLSSDPVTNPVGPLNEQLPSRVSRGGAWSYWAQSCRSAYRAQANPFAVRGFRPARSVD